MKKYLTEFIGTFFLVFTACLAVARGDSPAFLAIGAALMVMVYMGGNVSGAHYNPAVSIAVWLRRKMPASDLVPYFVAQLAGAVAAAAIADWILGRAIVPAPSPGTTAMQALAVEALYTFALALVVLNVATAKKAAGNSYFGFAIGFTVAAGAFAGGPVSGGAFNPALGVGMILAGAVGRHGPLGNAWLYVVGPCLGAAAAAGVFAIQETEG